MSSSNDRKFLCGEIWPDSDGVHINAHGGGLLYHGGNYYWYGEHKIEGEAGNDAHVGVRVYSSDDLYHWRNEGVALSVSDDPRSDIVKGCIIERPKVLYCEATGQFVMWFHLERVGEDRRSGLSGIAVSDTPTGPFTFLYSLRPNARVWPENVREDQMQPIEDMAALRAIKFSGGRNELTPKHNLLGRDWEGGQLAKDMTLFLDDDGKAYHIYSSEQNATLHISKLTDDFLRPAGKYVRVFEHRWMEAPAICKRKERYYLIASGCTGWGPNAARSAVADSIWGPWKELDNPAVGVNPQNGLGPEKTFGAQSTYIQKVVGKDDAYIAMFDIWRPKNAIDGRYVWLPISFTGNGFEVRWMDSWSLDWFEEHGMKGKA